MAKIVVILICLFVFSALYLSLFKQDYFLMIFSNHYHLLHKIAEEYKYCASQVSPSSEEFFFDKVATILREDKSCDDEFKRQIVNMLSRKEYYDYYFLRGKFDIRCYKEMSSDYRTGEYTSLPYQLEKTIIPLLPFDIAACHDAVKALERMIILGWLDDKCQIVKKSPEYPDAREKNEVYYAAQKICERFHIRRYDIIFGELWGVSDSTMRNSISNAMDGGSDSDKDKNKAIKRKILDELIDEKILKKIDH